MKQSTKAILTVVGGIASLLGIDALTKRIYGKDGYNMRGYDRDGYDRNGFDADGYDRDGRDQNGFDSEGYDLEGFDRDGYDRQKYNRDGRNCFGYDRDGYDSEGYDRSGYDHFGYNKEGIDRGKHDPSYYAEQIEEMATNQIKAKSQMKDGNFKYALLEIRQGLERGVRCIAEHKKGTAYSKLADNIDLCAFDCDFHDKLVGAKNHCNDMIHEDIDKTFDQVYFCLMMLKEVIEALQIITGLTKANADLLLGGTV